jgi:hypothetical protein
VLEIHETTKIYAARNGAASKKETTKVTTQSLKELLELDTEGELLGKLTKSFIKLGVCDSSTEGDSVDDVEGLLVVVGFILSTSVGDSDGLLVYIFVGLKLGSVLKLGTSDGCKLGVELGLVLKVGLREGFKLGGLLGLELSDGDDVAGGNTRRLY